MHEILACHSSLTERSASTSEHDLSVMSCSPEEARRDDRARKSQQPILETPAVRSGNKAESESKWVQKAKPVDLKLNK